MRVGEVRWSNTDPGRHLFRTSGSKTRYAFQASAIRTRLLHRRAKAIENKALLKSVPNRPSQQVRRESALGEPKSAVVPPVAVNRSNGKPLPNLGFSSRLSAAESLTSAKTGGGGATGYERSQGWSLARRFSHDWRVPHPDHANSSEPASAILTPAAALCRTDR
jgi:hypothetical protein